MEDSAREDFGDALMKRLSTKPAATPPNKNVLGLRRASWTTSCTNSSALRPSSRLARLDSLLAIDEAVCAMLVCPWPRTMHDAVSTPRAPCLAELVAASWHHLHGRGTAIAAMARRESTIVAG